MNKNNMRLSYKQLKSLKVETKSGTMLGHIADIVFDADMQSIVQYKVKGPVLSTKEFLVSRDQVYSFSEEKVVVYDTVVRRGIAKEAKVKFDSEIKPVGVFDSVK
jgi:sporulation protein YlmC with PRC-barrel domain